MKQKRYAIFLIFEAAALIFLTNYAGMKYESVFDLLALPLTALADLLGKMSLSSAVGNAFAIIVYACVCLIPIFVLLFRVQKKKFQKVDSLLILLSAVLFAVLYLLINPWKIGIRGELKGAGSLITFSVWSLLIGYLLLKFIGSVEKTNTRNTEKFLDIILKVLGIVFVFSVCAVSFSDYNASLVQLKENGSVDFTNRFLLLFSTVNTVLPNIFGVLIVFSSLSLVSEMSADRYSESTVKAAEKLSQICFTAIKSCIIVSLLYNVLQLRYITELSNVSFTADIPLVSLGFILEVLIMSQYIKDSRALKEDNDSFI